MSAPNIRLVDFKKDRHKLRAKKLLEQSCFVIEDIDHEVAGYIVMAWDDSGRTSVGYKSGGPVGLEALPLHCFSNMTSVTTMTRMENENYIPDGEAS